MTSKTIIYKFISELNTPKYLFECICNWARDKYFTACLRLTLRRKWNIFITGNLGQDGGRVCYFIQNGVAFLLEIEWEVF